MSFKKMLSDFGPAVSGIPMGSYWKTSECAPANPRSDRISMRAGRRAYAHERGMIAIVNWQIKNSNRERIYSWNLGCRIKSDRNLLKILERREFWQRGYIAMLEKTVNRLRKTEVDK